MVGVVFIYLVGLRFFRVWFSSDECYGCYKFGG